MARPRTDRRGFLATACGAVAGCCGLWASRVRAGDRPPVREPRATDGDDGHEPHWDERLTITVGRREADLVGDDDKVIQAGVDYLARLGGGTVARCLPGVYAIRNSVFLQLAVFACWEVASRKSVLTKISLRRLRLSWPTIRTGTIKRSLWQTPVGFEIGDGVVPESQESDTGGGSDRD